MLNPCGAYACSALTLKAARLPNNLAQSNVTIGQKNYHPSLLFAIYFKRRGRWILCSTSYIQGNHPFSNMTDNAPFFILVKSQTISSWQQVDIRHTDLKIRKLQSSSAPTKLDKRFFYFLKLGNTIICNGLFFRQGGAWEWDSKFILVPKLG